MSGAPSIARRRVGNRHGTRWRGQLAIPAHCNPLVRELFRRMNQQKTTIGEVAERSGFAHGTISDWRSRREPRLSHFVAVLNVLDLDLVIRARKEDE
jgi:hypothetical protein